MFPNLTSVVCGATRVQDFTLLQYYSITAAQVVIGVVVMFSILSNALVIKVFLSSECISPVHLLYVNISLSDELALLTSPMRVSQYLH